MKHREIFSFKIISHLYSITVLIALLGDALRCVASRFSKMIFKHCRGNFKSKSNSFS